MKTVLNDIIQKNGHYTLAQTEVANNTLSPTAQADLLDYAKDRLLELATAPHHHALLAALPAAEGRLIADQIKNSLQFARGILGYHDRETIPGENHGGMMICRGASGSANDRLQKCLTKLKDKGVSSPYLDALQNYLVEAEKYLNSFGGTNPFFPELGDTQINGAHHNHLNILARHALEFAGENAA